MARSLNLPYNRNNPRSLRGARKRGWTVVKVDGSYIDRDRSWLGLCIWADTQLGGYWVNSFANREFAFERPADATAFQLKWG